MVDFQSRDTRRGPTVDDESESDSAESSEDDTEMEGDGTEGAETEETPAGATERDGPDSEPETAGEPPASDDGDPLAEDHGQPTAETADGPLAESTGTATGAGAGGDVGVAATETPPASETATPPRAIDVAVVTVSGDRAALEDNVTAAFESAGHSVVRRERLRGGYDGIQQVVDTLVEREEVDVAVTVGSVGLAADEMAIEAVHPLLEKALPGFGEAFRSRLADHIGTGIVGVRSTAGVSDGTLVFCLPGDADAAELAVSEMLATEAPVLLDQLGG
jgi:molybdenum cofactor biosynthesis protein B